ncbi:hypothetical protein ACP4OV_000766 [Aristida adscensionis]
MDASKSIGGCTPVADLANTTGTGENNASSVATQVIDPKEHKRQRDRKRYAEMTDEQRN